MPTAIDMAQEVARAWAVVDAPAQDDMEYFTVGFGQRSKDVFLDVRPVDIDREDERFLMADALAEMSPRAAAAYLGPYLIAFFEDLALQEQEGFFAEPLVRGSVIAILTMPRAWSDILQPHLPDVCQRALGKALAYMLGSTDLLKLGDAQVRSLEKLSRAIARHVD